MHDVAVDVARLRRQQAAIASFGSFALRQPDLMKVLSEAARVCAEGLSVPFSKVCRYRAETNDLFIEAGHGWGPGVVGIVVSPADGSSPQGRAFSTGEPSICNDVREDAAFHLMPFYAAHGIISTIDVIIKGSDKPYGVLEIDSDVQHDYDQHDIDFLTSFANVLSEAVATSVRTALLETAIAQMVELVEEKDRLLDQKKVLAEELQHRVRNNLQLVYGMLNKQVDDTHDERSQRGIKAIARRVSTLAQVYDHLLGRDLTRNTDFGSYVVALCSSLAEIRGAPTGIVLTCKSEPLLLDLDTVTSLGIVVAEVVSNSYDHAFPRGGGTIEVTVRRTDGKPELARLRIADNGVGFNSAAPGERHGLGLVRRLVEQLRGAAVLTTNLGTVWTIDFPVPRERAASSLN